MHTRMHAFGIRASSIKQSKHKTSCNKARSGPSHSPVHTILSLAASMTQESRRPCPKQFQKGWTLSERLKSLEKTQNMGHSCYSLLETKGKEHSIGFVLCILCPNNGICVFLRSSRSHFRAFTADSSSINLLRNQDRFPCPGLSLRRLTAHMKSDTANLSFWWLSSASCPGQRLMVVNLNSMLGRRPSHLFGGQEGELARRLPAHPSACPQA